MAEGGIIHLGNDNKALDIPYWCPSSFQNVGIAFTGGIDSTALLCMLLSVYPPERIEIFHFNHYATPAMYKIAGLCGVNRVHIIPPPHSMKSAMRELCAYANENTNVEAVYLALDGNQVNGEEAAFFNIGVRIPFATLSKQHTIDLIYKLNYSHVLQDCYSCEHVQSNDILQHCGECMQCKSRIEGFKLLGLKDPTTYKNKES